jgi:hypothetical protein
MLRLSGTPSWHRIGLKTSGVDAAGNAGMHDPPGGRGMKTWAPRWSSQQAQYLRYVGFCWPVPCPALWRELLHCSKRRARCRFKSRRWRRNRRAMHSRARSTTRSLRASPKAEVTSSNLERYFARINAAEALRKRETRRNRTLFAYSAAMTYRDPTALCPSMLPLASIVDRLLGKGCLM